MLIVMAIDQGCQRMLRTVRINTVIFEKFRKIYPSITPPILIIFMQKPDNPQQPHKGPIFSQPIPLSIIQTPKPIIYHHQSNFKREFIKGALISAERINIQQLMLMLRELTAAIGVRPQTLHLWVETYLILFTVESEGIKGQDELTKRVAELLAQNLKKQGQINESKLHKICMMLFKELPISNKPNIREWCEKKIMDHLMEELVSIQAAQKVCQKITQEFIQGEQANKQVKKEFINYKLKEEQANEQESVGSNIDQ